MIKGPRELDPKLSELLAALEDPANQQSLLDDLKSVEAMPELRQKPSDADTNYPHTRSMDYVPRPELDAKLQAIEARLEGRVARIEDAVQRIAETTKEIRDESRATQAKISGLKAILVTTAIGSVIAIVLGVAAFNATLTSNMLSAFQAGLQGSGQSAAPAKPQP